MRAVNFFLANHWPGRRQQYRQYIRRAAALGSMSGGGLHDSEVAHSHATTSARAQVSVQTACGHVTMRQHYIHVNITRWWCGGSVSADRSATPWRSTRRHSSAKAKAGLSERLLSFTPGARRRVVSQDTPCCWTLARQAEEDSLSAARAPCSRRHVWPGRRPATAHAKRVGRRIAYSSTNGRATAEGATGSTKHSVRSPTRHASLRLERQKAG